MGHTAAAVALAARVGNDRAPALTGRAGLLDREEALLHANLTHPAAGCALRGFRTLLGTLTVALVAGDLGRHLDGDRVAANCALKVEVQLVAEVCATEYLAAATTGGATEDVAEYVAENVAEALGTESARTAPALQAVMTEPVIGRALLVVLQDLIGLLGSQQNTV